MLCNSLITVATATTMPPPAPAPAPAPSSHVLPTRYDHDQHRRWRRRNGNTIVSVSASASPLSINQMTMDSSSRRLKTYQEVVSSAREKFTQEISFQSKDKDISLAKALLYIASEDEAFITLNQEINACSLQYERRDVSVASNAQEWDCVEQMPLAGKTISQWVSELDDITKEVEAELVSRDIGCYFVELLDAVNLVLFELRGFKRSPVVVDSKYSYLHTVLSTRCGSAILLSIIYIEVCRRLGLTIVGSRVGEDFLIWPQMGNLEELFKVTSGHSLFAIVNGRCVEDPRSKASDLTGNSLLGLEIATKRDIIGIALANLIRLHWKRASRSNPGLMLTSPLRHAHNTDEKLIKVHNSSIPLLRPQDLRCCFRVSAAHFPVRPIEMAFQVTLIALFGNVLSSTVLVPPGMFFFAVLVLYPIFFRTSAGFVCVAVVGLGDWSSRCLGRGSFLCIIPGFFCFLSVVLPVGFVAAGDGSLFSFCMVVRLVFVFWGANFSLYCFLGLIYLFSYLLNCLFTA
ncbi:Transglut core2 domain-containing protein/TPR domain-containing [Salix suchowensis]|nr:Transglut core2 domain-containing protein/TPR domain-containing [Salix suchowensis]